MSNATAEEHSAIECRFLLQCMLIAAVMFFRLLICATLTFLVLLKASDFIFTVYWYLYDIILIADMLSDFIVYYKLNKDFRTIVQKKFQNFCCASNDVVNFHW